MGIKDQLTKIKENWLLVIIVLGLLFFFISGGGMFSQIGSMSSEALNIDMRYGGGEMAQKSMIAPSGGFAPEVASKRQRDMSSPGTR